MSSFEIRSSKGGLSDYEDKGTEGSFKFGSGLDIRKKVDSLSCQQGLVSETVSGLTDLPIAMINCDDGNSYAFCRDGKIFKRTSGAVWSLVYTDPDGAIKGAEQWYDNSGNTYMYWTTNTKIKKKPIPGLSDWSDLTTVGTTLTATTWHTLRQAIGALFIANDHYLGMVGYDNSFTENAVDLIKGNVVKTLIERGSYVVAGTGKKDSQRRGNLFAWETSALSWLNKKNIPAKGINAMIDTEITLMQAGTDGGLYFSDMVNVLPIMSLPGGGQVNPYGVDEYDGLALLGVYGATAIDGNTANGIYTYGRKKKNGNFSLNLEYPFDCDEIGAVLVIGSDIIFSYKSGSTYGVKRVDTTAKAQAIYQSLDLKAPVGVEDTVLWEQVQLITKDMPTGTAIEVWYRIDKVGSFVQAKMEGEVAQFAPDGVNVKDEAVFLVTGQGKIFELLLKLIPGTGANKNNTPEVYLSKIYFNNG